MITFCCWTLKPHSYFLLINYITMGVISIITQNTAYELYQNQNGNRLVLFLVSVFLLFSFVMGIVAFVAFMVFIFKDSWNNKYQQVYIQMAIIWYISALVIVGLLLLYLISAGSDPVLVGTFIGRWAVALLLLGFGLHWNLTVSKSVKESIAVIDEEEARPINGPVVI